MIRRPPTRLTPKVDDVEEYRHAKAKNEIPGVKVMPVREKTINERIGVVKKA